MTSAVPTYVFFALEREARAFHRRVTDAKITSSGIWCSPRHHLVIALLGVGRTESRQRLEAIMKGMPPPGLVIVAGFAGSLIDKLPVGHVQAMARVVDDRGGDWATHWPVAREGTLYTSPVMIGDPAEKSRSGTLYRAELVDMESAEVAAYCGERGIPFGCVRVVSDEVNQKMSPRLMTLVESGRVPIGKLLKELLRSPKLLFELLRLARHTRKAAAKLAEFLANELKTRSRDAEGFRSGAR